MQFAIGQAAQNHLPSASTTIKPVPRRQIDRLALRRLDAQRATQLKCILHRTPRRARLRGQRKRIARKERRGKIHIPLPVYTSRQREFSRKPVLP